MMTASPDVRRGARLICGSWCLAPLLGVCAFSYDGVYIGATWARDMRNLMVLSLVIFLVGLVCAPRLRQRRTMGCAADHLCRARRAGGAALSLAVEGVVCARAKIASLRAWTGPRSAALLLSGARRVPIYTGQSSAVIVAASAPTISDSKSRPVRSKVEARSLLMPRPDQGPCRPARNKAGSGWRRRGFSSARRRRNRCRRRRSAGTRLRRAHRSPPPSASTAETAAGPTGRPVPSRGRCSRKLEGRASVVLATIMPSTLRERAICTTSSSSARLRSGAILSSTGESPAFCAHPLARLDDLCQEIVERAPPAAGCAGPACSATIR